MERISGSKNTALIECINPVKNKWKVRWNYRETDETNASFMEHDFGHQPGLIEIKEVIISWYNQKINRKILSGFKWNEIPVWLSSENQFNFKAAFDLAYQTAGSTLPVVFKLGTDECPVYHSFENMDELTDFHKQWNAYIQNTLQEGWKAKESICWEKYSGQ